MDEKVVERRKQLVKASIALHAINHAMEETAKIVAEKDCSDEKLQAVLLVFMLGLPDKLADIRDLLRGVLQDEIVNVQIQKATETAS